MRVAIPILPALLPAMGLAQPVDEERLIKQVMDRFNPISIAEDREYCGYVGFDAAGRLVATQGTPGDVDSCLAADPDGIELVTASWHTHGSFSRDYSSEVPSVEDIEGDEDEGIDGWVATPGGRLWFIDTTDMAMWQVCGIGCLPSDPAFIVGDDGIVADEYSYDELVTRFE
ncbi:MAG: DUF4329 domain-containing protein [Paracoccaceae bacterium]